MRRGSGGYRVRFGMSRRAAPFTQADISRALRAAAKESARQGVPWAVEIMAGGVIRLAPATGEGEKPVPVDSGPPKVF